MLYENQACSAARALEIVGERWSLLILRDALFRGLTRFSDFQRSLGLAPNVLANRLESFVEAGIMDARPASPNSEHREYVLTPKGLDFKPTVIALTEWGDKWVAPGPAVFEHGGGCGATVEQRFRCTVCGASPHMTEVHARARAPQIGKAKSRTRRPTRSRRSR